MVAAFVESVRDAIPVLLPLVFGGYAVVLIIRTIRGSVR